jgi:serine/threonine-protein kinase
MAGFDADPLRGLTDSLLGQVLPGSEGRKYPLSQLIGQGGQGWVFRATWNGSVDVVVKVLRPDAATKEQLVRFQREAHVLRMLSQQSSPNPHVVRFFDHAYVHVQVPATGSSWDLPFTVLELVDGETLEKAIERAQPSGLDLDRARRILRHVVLALEDVHAHNVVHRDLKPSNILLTTVGTREIAKVTDFGLAKLLDPGMEGTANMAGATVGYAPPEQFERGNLRVGRHTDVFSLAAIFYELVTGKPAFPFPPNAHPFLVMARILSEQRPAFGRVPESLPPELAERPDVIAAVDAELGRALSPQPSERHATVTELHAAIERALETLSGTPSLPVNRSSGEVIVRSGGPPGWGAPDRRLSGDKVVTWDASSWRSITAPLGVGTFRAIAVSASGGRAVALETRGPAQWSQGQWSHVDVPAGVDPRAWRTVGWQDDRMLFAGASPLVVAIEPGAPAVTTAIDAPGVVLHGIFADALGVVLTGERQIAGGPVGVVSEIHGGPRGGASGVLDIAGAGALRAGVRLGTEVLACGDGGSLVMAPSNGDSPRVRRVCDAPLMAVAALGDGTAAAVGAGAYAFRVWPTPTLDAQLESTETRHDLFALAHGPRGFLWCAGASGRILRREPQGWVRVGADGVSGRVLALHASERRLLAFCDDGMVLEGAPREA